jgi:hypothetical protein
MLGAEPAPDFGKMGEFLPLSSFSFLFPFVDHQLMLNKIIPQFFCLLLPQYSKQWEFTQARVFDVEPQPLGYRTSTNVKSSILDIATTGPLHHVQPNTACCSPSLRVLPGVSRQCRLAMPV